MAHKVSKQSLLMALKVSSLYWWPSKWGVFIDGPQSEQAVFIDCPQSEQAVFIDGPQSEQTVFIDEPQSEKSLLMVLKVSKQSLMEAHKVSKQSSSITYYLDRTVFFLWFTHWSWHPKMSTFSHV